MTADGELVLWEHLGMMQREDYRKGWEWKQRWCEANGFTLGQNLFTSEDGKRGGLGSASLRTNVTQIQEQLE